MTIFYQTIEERGRSALFTSVLAFVSAVLGFCRVTKSTGMQQKSPDRCCSSRISLFEGYF